MDASPVAVEPPMSPRSRPGSLDLYGKRRQMVKVQALEREIHHLQEELKSVEHIQPASRYCKEVDDFVGAKPDPFVARTPEVHKSCSFWKRFWGNCCLNLSWICCCTTSRLRLKRLNIFTNCIACNSSCIHACCSEKTCCLKCPDCKGDSCCCPSRACYCLRSFFHNCTKVISCSSCIKACCP
ncbi:hypothetical protein SLE2022_385500 [Rubroshorea leprosula]